MAAFKPYRPRARAHRAAAPRPDRASRANRAVVGAPPSGALINAVLQFADLRDDMGGGRVLLRVSPARMAEPAVRDGLGEEAGRLADVALIWDERDEALVRVLDGASPPPEIVTLALVERPAPAEDDHFVLTPAALEYIARSQSRGRG
jgi:hypothetical protein